MLAHNLGEGGLVVLGRDIPVLGPGELRVGHTLACIGHALDTEVCAICQNGSENGMGLVMLLARASVVKWCKKPGALGNLEQEFGDLDTQKQRIEPAVQGLRLRRSCRLPQHNLQLVANEGYTK